MTIPTDPTDPLDPAGVEHVPPGRALPQARRLALNNLLQEEVRRSARPWWRRSGRAATIGAGAVALVLAGGAASAYVAFRPADTTRGVQCFAAADQAAAHQAPAPRVYVVHSRTGSHEKLRKGTDPITDPVGQCALLWRDGILRTADPTVLHKPLPAGVSRAPAPRLVACTLEDGVAGVFPGKADTCERLDLPRTRTG